ncbi:MAG: carbamoyltransferase [Acidobacteria bacterium]|nr:carbamoyltransferase [Acidobacteriota bacterium]
MTLRVEKSSPNILGIAGGDHDAAAALLRGGEIVAALEEEKLARVRRVRGLPWLAIRYCLEAARLSTEEVHYVALARPLYEEASEQGRGESWIPKRLKQEFPASRIVVLDHHLCHAAAAYYPSSFDKAGVLTLDEKGDLKTGSFCLAYGNSLQPLEDSYFPDSLGNVFSRVSALVGFQPRGDEHKLQWLSAWGKPVYASVFRQLLHPNGESLLSVDQSFFATGRDERGGFAEKFFQAAGLDPAAPLSEQSRVELAASMQQALEETVVELCCRLASRYQVENLCLAGGVGLNSLLVEKLETCGLFPGVFAQPAAGNAGNALGAALYCAHAMLGLSPRCLLEHLYFGPQYSSSEIKDVLENCKLRFRYFQKRDELVSTAVEALRQDHIVGWFEGRAEFGPRALGARSILASPLGSYVNENLNSYVKHREKFRPFAASVTEERAGEFFECGPMVQYLASVGKVKSAYKDTFASNLLPNREQKTDSASPSRIRVHVVSRRTNPLFWELLDTFGKATGLPVLFNTSFNLFGEPLVCSPRDAVRSFYCSGIDHLIIGNFSVSK